MLTCVFKKYSFDYNMMFDISCKEKILLVLFDLYREFKNKKGVEKIVKKMKSFYYLDSKFYLEDQYNTISVASNWDIYIWENACHNKSNKVLLGNILINWDYIFKNYKKIVINTFNNDWDLVKVLSNWIMLSGIYDINWNIIKEKFKNYILLIKSIIKILW